MINSIDVKSLHEQMIGAHPKVQEGVAKALLAMCQSLRENEFDTAMDDRAEVVAATIYNYILESMHK